VSTLRCRPFRGSSATIRRERRDAVVVVVVGVVVVVDGDGDVNV